MSEFIVSRFFRRLFARRLAETDEMEAYGARGEETVYRILRESFDCVIRNPVIPRGDGYLEKDFLIISRGVPVVLEVKSWKGKIWASSTGGRFFQDKADGTRKELKSPVDTTRSFLSAMKGFYGLDVAPLGMVAFTDPDSELDLPAEMDGISLVSGKKMVSAIRALVKNAPTASRPLEPQRVLRCARLYSRGGRSFCKGVVTDTAVPCYTTHGEKVALNPLFLRYVSVDHQPLRLRDRLTVTFANDSAATFYNHSATLTLLCLDGSVLRVPISRLSTIVF